MDSSYLYKSLQELKVKFQSRTKKPNVLILGDSVLERISHHDQDTIPLGILLKNAYKNCNTYVISSTAFNFLIFEQIAIFIKNNNLKIDQIILPINMRSFSPQWLNNPKWKLEEEVLTTRIFPKKINSIYKFVKNTKIFNKIEKFIYGRSVSEYHLYGKKRASDFGRIVSDKSNSIYSRDFRLKSIFIFHYLFKINGKNEGILAMKKFLIICKLENIHLYMYITPINYQAAEHLIGRDFIKKYYKNVAFVKNQISRIIKSGLVLKDFSTACKKNSFFSLYDATEHLNQEGRSIIVSLFKLGLISRKNEN